MNWRGIGLDLFAAAAQIPFMIEGKIFSAVVFGVCIGVCFCQLVFGLSELREKNRK